MDKDKEEFLSEFGDDYGYPLGPKTIDEIRATEFKRLAHGTVRYPICKFRNWIWWMNLAKQYVFSSVLLWIGADAAYLDHAGATLYSELQMEAVFKDLTSNVYGNPRILVKIKFS